MKTWERHVQWIGASLRHRAGDSSSSELAQCWRVLLSLRGEVTPDRLVDHEVEANLTFP